MPGFREEYSECLPKRDNRIGGEHEKRTDGIDWSSVRENLRPRHDGRITLVYIFYKTFTRAVYGVCARS